MDPLPIIIYLRKTPNDYVEGYCSALLLNGTRTHVTLLTQTWISPALDRHYYVMTKADAGQPPEFRELEIYKHQGQAAVFRYTLKLGEKWSGKIVFPVVENQEGEA